jgi:hypothetical protein
VADAENRRSGREVSASVHWLSPPGAIGPLVLSVSAPIDDRDSLADVAHRAQELGEMALEEALYRIAATETVDQPLGSGEADTPQQTMIVRPARLVIRHLWHRIVNGLRPIVWVKTAAAMVFLLIVRPMRDLGRRIRRTHPVRVFTFHRVSDLCRDGMTVSPARFDQQLAAIGRYHDVLQLDKALDLLRSGTRLSRHRLGGHRPAV